MGELKWSSPIRANRDYWLSLIFNFSDFYSRRRLLRVVSWITRHVQIKGAARVLWALRSLFGNDQHVYHVDHGLRLRVDESQLYQWWYVVNYSAYATGLLL